MNNTNKLKICYYLGAIGNPKFDMKFDVLVNNLKILKQNTQNTTVDLFVCCYDEEKKSAFQFGNQFDKLKQYVDNICIHAKNGILAELWLSNPFDEKISDYDYLMLVLDDVKFNTSFDMLKLINLKQKYNLHIISPMVANATHKYMYFCPKLKNFALTSELEMFCYLMNPSDWILYKNCLDIENPWIWGNDILLGFQNIKCGIYFGVNVDHLIKSKFGTPEYFTKISQMNTLFKKKGWKNKTQFVSEHRNSIIYFEE